MSSNSTPQESVYCIIVCWYVGTVNGCSFLETENGQPYSCVFNAIRIQHILNDLMSVKTLEADGIIAKSETVHVLSALMGTRPKC